MNNKIIVFAGPSGSGKDTILREIMSKSDRNVKLTTATTRSPRQGEEDGLDYYFLSRKEFLQNVEKGIIPEHNEHANELYGIYLPDLEKKIEQGKNVIVQVQLKGAMFLKEKYGAILFFINAESFQILEDRIRSRSTLSEKEIVKRIEIAKNEVVKESPVYDYTVINKQGKLDETIESILDKLNKEGVLITDQISKKITTKHSG